MFVLIGEGYDVVQHHIGESFVQEDFETRVALFDVEADAKAYAESFRLSNPRSQSFSSPQVFRANSPMCLFVSYRIETDEKEFLPVNPIPRGQV